VRLDFRGVRSDSKLVQPQQHASCVSRLACSSERTIQQRIEQVRGFSLSVSLSCCHLVIAARRLRPLERSALPFSGALFSQLLASGTGSVNISPALCVGRVTRLFLKRYHYRQCISILLCKCTALTYPKWRA